MSARLTALAAGLMFASSVAGAQATRQPFDSALEARTSKLSSRLRCPVCQGLSIEDSPAELAVQMRSLVRDQLAAGRTEDEVQAFFVARYGEYILLAPKPTGFNLVVYVLPALALVGGAVFVTILVRRWTVAGSQAAAPDTGANAPD